MKASKIHTKIILLNKAMLHERKPIPESKLFECLYGLGPETVKELGNPYLTGFLLNSCSNPSIQRALLDSQPAKHCRRGPL